MIVLSGPRTRVRGAVRPSAGAAGGVAPRVLRADPRGRSGGPGGDLLFRAFRRSTIGAEGFHGRVRDGIGCFAPRYGHQAGKTAVRPRERNASRWSSGAPGLDPGA